MNQEYKIKKIREIASEVDEFHPILKDLFPKLSEITRAEYTHGPNEMGADFVLHKRDSTLDSEDYIGVIVKCGSIRQDFTDIERQIKECAISRKVEGGKKSIVLNEIWIVINGSISENAQRKINELFKSQNIKFIWDERLVVLFDKFYPEFWENIDRNVGLYLSALSRRTSDLNAKSGVVDLAYEDFYIDQEVIRVEFESKKKFSLNKTSKPEKLSSALKKERFILVEAGMGYGKSRLLRQTALEYASYSKFIEEETLPVFLTFRDLIEVYDNNLEKLLSQITNNEKIDPNKYSIIFVIDAVDETKGDSLEKAEKIGAFVAQLIPNKKMHVVFAARPFDDPNVEEVLDKSLVRYQLKPLSIQKLVLFIEKVCKETVVTNRFKNDLHKSDLFKSLPKTPISAILLGRVLNSNLQELPSTLPELYSKFVELALGRWEIKKGNGSEKEYETTVIIMRIIAQFMMRYDLSEIGIGDAKQLIADYLSKRHTGQSVEQIFTNISSCAEIICVDEIKNKLFFRHRTFMEFMFSDALFIEFGKNAKLENPFDPFWGAVNYFYLGKLKDCPEKINEIFKLIPESDAEKVTKIFQAGTYLLAAYQTPYEVITESLKKIILEAADWYYQVCENPDKYPIAHLSEIHVLAIMTSLMRNSFEYDFFKSALLSVETDVLLSMDTDKKKAIAGFFTAAIRAGLGERNAFDALITNHLHDLPLALKLGITHASSDAAITNDHIKTLEKKMARLRKSNPTLTKTLYLVPLNERQDPRLL